MNFNATSAQRQVMDFYETDIAEIIGEGQSSKPRKPRLTTEQLLNFVVKRWRELKQPPQLKELDPHRYAVTKRFRNLRNTHEQALLRLTEKEQREFVYRCQYCNKSGFAGAKGWKSHERFCKKRSGEER